MYEYDVRLRVACTQDDTIKKVNASLAEYGHDYEVALQITQQFTLSATRELTNEDIALIVEQLREKADWSHVEIERFELKGERNETTEL